jgi:hypothetical protein
MASANNAIMSAPALPPPRELLGTIQFLGRWANTPEWLSRTTISK